MKVSRKLRVGVLLTAVVLVLASFAISFARSADSQQRFSRDLYAAVLDGNAEKVRKLIRLGADPNVRETPAVRPHGFVELFERVLRPQEYGESGPTALFPASVIGRSDIVKMLLDAGADVNASDWAGNALTAATINGRGRIVEQLLAAGADPNASVRQGSSYPLEYALVACDGRTVRSLLDHGARFDPLSTEAMDLAETAATFNRDASALAVLLDQGYDIERKDPHAHMVNLLHCAAGRGNTAVVRMLLDRGAYINARDSDGTTALTWAQLTPAERQKRHADLYSLGSHEPTIRLLRSRGGKN